MLFEIYQTDRFDIYNGNCLDIMPKLGKVDACVSDPPYGCKNKCNYKRFSHNGARSPARQDFRPVVSDDRPFDPTPLLGFKKVCLFGFNHFSDRLPQGAMLIWLKKHANGFGKFLSDAEVAWSNHGIGCWVFHHVWSGALKDSEKGTRNVHPTQKPVEVMKWVLDRLKVPVGATVLDPYMGSGSTGVACLQTGRRFIGIEIDPHYFSIAKSRLEEAAAHE